MSELYVRGINTNQGTKQIDYNYLANLPEWDTNLSATEHGLIADSKATKDAIGKISTSVNNMSTEMETFKGTINTSITDITSSMEVFKGEVDEQISKLFTQTTEKPDDGDEIVKTTIKTPLDMDNNKITGLPEPTENTDAATKQYVDDAVGGIFQQEEGDGDTFVTIQTTIQMGENTTITGLPDPKEDTDAANKKYVDDSLTKITEYVNDRCFHWTVQLFKDNWKGVGGGDTAPFTQKIVDLEGISENDAPHWGIIYSGETIEDKLIERAAFSYVDDLDTADNELTFTCFTTKPGVNLNVQIEVNR